MRGTQNRLENIHQPKQTTNPNTISQTPSPQPIKSMELERMNKEIQQLKRRLETSATQIDTHDGNMEKMPQQITVEGKEAFQKQWTYKQ